MTRPTATLRAMRDAIGAAASLRASGAIITGAHAHDALAVVCVAKPKAGRVSDFTSNTLDGELDRIGHVYGVRVEVRR